MTEERRGRSLPRDLPAFPNEFSNLIPGKNGMSKREHFAVLLLAGMNANPERSNSTVLMVSDAIAQADELIAQFEELAREES
jgi:hypothetical protein